jgi:hypothetical protein
MYILRGRKTQKLYVKIFENEADVAFQAVRCAEITLLAGFTTVRDLGGTVLISPLEMLFKV